MTPKTPISEVYNCDCMEYMRTMPDKFFDLAIVDPPYGIKNSSSAITRIAKYGQLKTANDYKPDESYFKELFRVSKNQIIWGYNHLSDMLPSCSEFIFWYKHQPVETYAAGELAWTSFGKTGKCFDFPYFGTYNADKHRIHPTQKPIKLYNWLIDKYIGGEKRYWTPTSGVAHQGLQHTSLGWTSMGANWTRSISTHSRSGLKKNVCTRSPTRKRDK